jgi:hypothetical protein
MKTMDSRSRLETHSGFFSSEIDGLLKIQGIYFITIL